MAFSSWSTTLAIFAAVAEMPYSVQNLPGKGDPAAADGLLLEGSGGQSGSARPARPTRPSGTPRKLTQDQGANCWLPCSPDHVGGDGLVVYAGLAGQRAEEAGSVQPGAGAEHPPPGQFQMQCQFPGDNVAGVGDVDNHTVKPAGFHPVGKAPDGGNGEVHLRQAVMGAPQQVNFSHAVDEDVAAARSPQSCRREP